MKDILKMFERVDEKLREKRREDATFELTLEIDYPLAIESEDEAREWLKDTYSLNGDEINATVKDIERVD